MVRRISPDTDLNAPTRIHWPVARTALHPVDLRHGSRTSTSPLPDPEIGIGTVRAFLPSDDAPGIFLCDLQSSIPVKRADVLLTHIEGGIFQFAVSRLVQSDLD